MQGKVQVPDMYEEDIRRAVAILKEAGCTDVFLFGSLTAGKPGDGWESDIDLAVRGCPKEQFFHILGKLLLELDHPVDLVSLDREDAFSQRLETNGELLRLD